MSEKHLSKAELVDWYYETTAAKDVRESNHLQFCETCRREYAAIAATLSLTHRLTVEPLSAAQKARMFEQAWAESRKVGKIPWTQFLFSWLRRPALTFALGVMCGLSAVFFLTEKPAGSSQTEDQTTAKSLSESILRMNSYGSVQTLQGEAVQKMYPQIENPVLIVEQNSDASETSHRVLYGTVDNGKVQIVWNM